MPRKLKGGILGTGMIARRLATAIAAYMPRSKPRSPS